MYVADQYNRTIQETHYEMRIPEREVTYRLVYLLTLIHRQSLNRNQSWQMYTIQVHRHVNSFRFRPTRSFEKATVSVSVITVVQLQRLDSKAGVFYFISGKMSITKCVLLTCLTVLVVDVYAQSWRERKVSQSSRLSTLVSQFLQKDNDDLRSQPTCVGCQRYVYHGQTDPLSA